MTKHITLLLLLSGLSCSSAVFAAEPLGRLFFSPAQRNALDAGKKITAPRATRAPAAPRGPREITLNGVVTRSDGEYTVWVNGRAVGKGGPPGVSATPSANHPSAARVNLRGTNNPVELRVGQQLKRSTGKIVEPYEPIVGRTEVAMPVGKERKPATRNKPMPPDSETPSGPSSDH
jgi:hypothetical protein